MHQASNRGEHHSFPMRVWLTSSTSMASFLGSNVISSNHVQTLYLPILIKIVIYGSTQTFSHLTTETSTIYNRDALSAFNLAIISSCAASLCEAYFRNSDFWSPSHTTTLPFPSCASMMTRMGYLLMHFGVTSHVGKTRRTHDMAVSRSWAPPSQFRDWKATHQFVIVWMKRRRIER